MQGENRFNGLESALEALPEASRTSFLLAYQEGLSLTEIAAAMGSTPRTVQRQIQEASRLLPALGVDGEFLERIVAGRTPVRAPLSSVEEPETLWSPEEDLVPDEPQLVLPNSFLRASSSYVSDPRILEYLIANPEELRGLTPRRFEEFVADLLVRFGYRARLTGKGRDGGVDVFAERDGRLGHELVLVQCKRYAERRKVGVPVIKQLHTEVRDRNATRGIVVTTSAFTEPAISYIERVRFRLTGADLQKLQEWITRLRSGGEAPEM